MNRMMLTMAAVMTVSAAACAQNRGEKRMQTDSKALVVYFSATGTTARAARTIAEATGGTLYEIVPQQAYTSDDLDWRNRQSRSSVEMNDPQARPALKRYKSGCCGLRCHLHRLSRLVESGAANCQYIH